MSANWRVRHQDFRHPRHRQFSRASLKLAAPNSAVAKMTAAVSVILCSTIVCTDSTK